MPCCICESLRILSAEMWRCPAICTKSALEINKNTALNTRVTVQDTTDIFSLLEETDYRRLLLLQCVIAATVHQSMSFLAALAYFSILLNSVKMDLTVYG